MMNDERDTARLSSLFHYIYIIKEENARCVCVLTMSANIIMFERKIIKNKQKNSS